MLKETFPYILAESVACDTVWATGTDLDDERTYKIEEWQGQNLLGKILMKVREML